MKRLVFILLSVVFSIPAHCQEVGRLVIEQTAEVSSAFEAYVLSNGERKLNGYRIRIFFDSGVNARSVSEEVAGRFSELYPEIPVYRSYSSPFFKVTVGDFRTRDDAHMFAKSISGQFPSTFLVREAINFPALWSNKD